MDERQARTGHREESEDVPVFDRVDYSSGYQRLDNGEPARELFEDVNTEHVHTRQQPWWKANFFIKEPVLFGTWDGVFTTCMINIFGVIVFLRVGWMVGYAGVGLASLIILLTIAVGLSATLSVIGLVRKYPMGDATCDIFHVVAFALGRRIGGVIGILYVFGQAVAVALYATGLGEAMSELFNWEGQWPIRGVAFVTATFLLAIVLAGVQWVVKLQLILLLFLAIAVFDFIVGTFAHTDPGHGFLGYGHGLIGNNTNSSFSGSKTFFSVFGVFFPTVTGVAAGINMARDLRKPRQSIPIGTTAALATSGSFYLVFAILLGATCTRSSLKDDSLIAYHVSLVGALFLIGLYISSLSSCLGGLYAAPRVLQSVCSERIIPLLEVLGRGHGPNNEPVIATLVVASVSFVFIFIGHLNKLALVVNMPFLVTYAAIDYAYFALSMSSPRNVHSFLYEGPIDFNTKSPEKQDMLSGEDPPEERLRLLSNVGNMNGGVRVEKIKNDDEKPTKEPYTIGRRQYLEKMTLNASWQVSPSQSTLRNRQEKQPTYVTALKNRLRIPSETQERMATATLTTLNRMANPLISLVGAICSVLIMFCIHWGFALAAICAGLLLYIYIGHVNSGLPPGQADFRMSAWLKSLWSQARQRQRACANSSPAVGEHSVITKPTVPFDFSVQQQTEGSEDYNQRPLYHHQAVHQSQPTMPFPIEVCAPHIMPLTSPLNEASNPQR